MTRPLRFLAAIVLLVASTLHPLAHDEATLVARSPAKTDCACLHGATPPDPPANTVGVVPPATEYHRTDKDSFRAIVLVREVLGRAPPAGRLA